MKSWFKRKRYTAEVHMHFGCWSIGIRDRQDRRWLMQDYTDRFGWSCQIWLTPDSWADAEVKVHELNATT
jgi:hypothetical protein